MPVGTVNEGSPGLLKYSEATKKLVLLYLIFLESIQLPNCFLFLRLLHRYSLGKSTKIKSHI